jgi:hypothetical protein
VKSDNLAGLINKPMTCCKCGRTVASSELCIEIKTVRKPDGGTKFVAKFYCPEHVPPAKPSKD